MGAGGVTCRGAQPATGWARNRASAECFTGAGRLAVYRQRAYRLPVAPPACRATGEDPRALEMGGNNPLIVEDPDDIDAAVHRRSSRHLSLPGSAVPVPAACWLSGRRRGMLSLNAGGGECASDPASSECGTSTVHGGTDFATGGAARLSGGKRMKHAEGKPYSRRVCLLKAPLC